MFGNEQALREVNLIEQAQQKERAKWLPLWEMVEKLEVFSLFDQHNFESGELLTVKAEMRQVMIKLKNQGE